MALHLCLLLGQLLTLQLQAAQQEGQFNKPIDHNKKKPEYQNQLNPAFNQSINKFQHNSTLVHNKDFYLLNMALERNKMPIICQSGNRIISIGITGTYLIKKYSFTDST